VASVIALRRNSFGLAGRAATLPDQKPFCAAFGWQMHLRGAIVVPARINPLETMKC